MLKTRYLNWLIIWCCFVIYFLYYGVNNNVINKLVAETFIHNPENTDYLINTPGCAIPKYSKSFKHTPLERFGGWCDHRYIFIKQISDMKILFIIDAILLKKLRRYKMPYSCYYNYALRSTEVGQQDTSLKYTENKVFENGTMSTLQHEVITVQCSLANSSRKPIYKDVFMFVKKKVKPLNSSGSKWNVLIIGMDTMSRARVYQTMPKLVQYLKDEKWLDFRAYQKVGLNTFPNIMAGLGGLRSSSSGHRKRNATWKFLKQHLIWTQYSNSGYATAYGEDYLECPDTFSRYRLATPLTDHYMRPLFLVGEEQAGRLLCVGHLSSGQHILDYAARFTDAYKQNNYFGLFWINSYSHHGHQDPALFDDAVKYFFVNLKKNSLLNNTFVIFYSDHGIRFGADKLKAESFYDERLPMFFMRMPDLFIHKHPEEAQNAIINQYRLVTTYDFYLTLWAILAKSDNKFETKSLDFCPGCNSIFESQPVTRTCADAGVDAIPWCACCHLQEIAKDTPISNSLTKIVTENINTKMLLIETVKCKDCIPMTFYKSLRIHKCFDKGTNLTRYLFAFIMNPFAVGYEAIISQENMKVISLNTISGYTYNSSCAEDISNHAYCICTEYCVDEYAKLFVF